MKHLKNILIIMFISITCSYANGLSLGEEISSIRYNITAIEHKDKDENKIEQFDKLISETDKLIKEYPNSAEPYLWKGIALSAQAKHKGISALSSVREAKELLEKSISINPSASDGAAYNALGMLYYKVPGWPISFGNNKKAEKNFREALKISSNLDTNYRYGEFLISQGNIAEGLKYLNKAYLMPNRESRKEDSLKKEEVKKLIGETERK